MSKEDVTGYMAESTHVGNKRPGPKGLFYKTKEYVYWLADRLHKALNFYADNGYTGEVIENGLEFPELPEYLEKLHTSNYAFACDEHLKLGDYFSRSNTYEYGCVGDEYLTPLHDIINRAACSAYWGDLDSFDLLVATYGKGAIDGRILAAVNMSPYLSSKGKRYIRDIVQSVGRDSQWILFVWVPPAIGDVEWWSDHRRETWFARLTPPS